MIEERKKEMLKIYSKVKKEAQELISILEKLESDLEEVKTEEDAKKFDKNHGKDLDNLKYIEVDFF